MTPLIRALASSVPNAKFNLLNSNVWPNVLYFIIFYSHLSLFFVKLTLSHCPLSLSHIIGIRTWKRKRKNKKKLKKEEIKNKNKYLNKVVKV